MIWKRFEELNAVPRPSKKEERVIEFMKSFGESTFPLVGASVEHSGGYPGWKPNADSTILHSMKAIYKDLLGS